MHDSDAAAAAALLSAMSRLRLFISVLRLDETTVHVQLTGMWLSPSLPPLSPPSPQL
jgi:hypothetical protein